MRFFWLFVKLTVFVGYSFAQESGIQIGLLKYRGGGDWYANPTSLPNLVKFCNEQLKTSISKQIVTIDVSDNAMFELPFVHMTGHGNVFFTASEADNLRRYLIGGGFLHISDNYGMDAFVRREMKKVFPELEWVELPFSHPIYHAKFDFKAGLPKVHEHDQKAPQGFGLFYQGRLVCFYDYECDLGDGWEDREVHNDPEELRQKALKMGGNIIWYSFTN